MTVRGGDFPECRIPGEPELSFTARGQEPGWLVTIDADTIFLNAGYDALQLRMPKPDQPSAKSAG